MEILQVEESGLKLKEGPKIWFEKFEAFGKASWTRRRIKENFPDFPWTEEEEIFLPPGHGMSGMARFRTIEESAVQCRGKVGHDTDENPLARNSIYRDGKDD